jgi:hypothetical protein
MSKPSRRKRKNSSKPNRPQGGGVMPWSAAPSAQTLLRAMLLDPETRSAVAAVMARLDPTLWKRDQKRLERIASARSVEELLERATSATGLAEQAWLERVREFGPGAAPVIAEGFRRLNLAPLHKDRALIEEKCVEGLRWCGEAGIAPLLQIWDALSNYGRSLAAVVLGLLQARQAADGIWGFYEKVKDNRENLLVGALWGLIDLNDERAADALWELLDEGRRFYELFGFVCRAGDRRAIVPLLQLAVEGDGAAKEEAMWAMTGVGHRIGCSALIEEVARVCFSDDEAGRAQDALADRILSFSAAAAAGILCAVLPIRGNRALAHPRDRSAGPPRVEKRHRLPTVRRPRAAHL